MEARRFEHTKDWKQILGQFDGYKCVLCSQQKVSPVVYLLSSEFVAAQFLNVLLTMFMNVNFSRSFDEENARC